MGYIGQTLRDIFGKTMGYIGLRLVGYFIGYIRQTLWEILGKNYGNIMGYIGLKLFNIFGKTLGYTGPLDILR